jgi:energy-coupling factor transporter transmembrane protein EcfT
LIDLPMKLHPVTFIIIAFECALLTVLLPVWKGFAAFIILFATVAVIPSKTDVETGGVFMRFLIIAAFFLFLINGVKWFPTGIDLAGIENGTNSFVNIGACFLFIVLVSKTLHSEEIFALMVSLKIPSSIILIFFRTAWLVPRFSAKMRDVLAAQKLRGMRVSSFTERAGAVIPALNPIISAMFEEIARNALVITSRGFLAHGVKSSRLELAFSAVDYFLILTVTTSITALLILL